MESPSKLYLPRFYGQDRFGLASPENVKFAEPEKSNMIFNGSLRKEQQPIAQLYLDSAKKGRWWTYLTEMWRRKNSAFLMDCSNFTIQNHCLEPQRFSWSLNGLIVFVVFAQCQDR